MRDVLDSISVDGWSPMCFRAGKVWQQVSPDGRAKRDDVGLRDRFRLERVALAVQLFDDPE